MHSLFVHKARVMAGRLVVMCCLPHRINESSSCININCTQGVYGRIFTHTHLCCHVYSSEISFFFSSHMGLKGLVNENPRQVWLPCGRRFLHETKNKQQATHRSAEILNHRREITEKPISNSPMPSGQKRPLWSLSVKSSPQKTKLSIFASISWICACKVVKSKWF